MSGHRRMREGHEFLYLRDYPKENIVLSHYMISAWWLHLMYGLEQCVIHPGTVAQIMVTTKNIMNLG